MRRNLWRLRVGSPVSSEVGDNVWARRKRLRELTENLLVWRVNIAAEVERVEREISAEHRQMSNHWNRWERKMTTWIMGRPLPNNWVVRNDPETEIRTYLDLRSGIIHNDHPYTSEAAKLRRREFEKARKILEGRTARLESYKERLLSRGDEHYADVTEKLRVLRGS